MTTYETRLNAIGRWLQGLLTWTPGQTDIIKTIALVLMVIDHTGLLLAGNNGVASENGIYGHSRFCNTDFDDKLACLNLSGV
ncbi:hypothetical protein AI2943V1_5408 (plasmid) [Klebsiella oxytoca]|nr:hypothetical protein AI2943V1_5408 [Klebsiella oxytoca]CAH5767198.1 hypothetical protein AI2943V1_5408 [Klebsiella oxytoca]